MNMKFNGWTTPFYTTCATGLCQNNKLMFTVYRRLHRELRKSCKICLTTNNFLLAFHEYKYSSPWIPCGCFTMTYIIKLCYSGSYTWQWNIAFNIVQSCIQYCRFRSWNPPSTPCWLNVYSGYCVMVSFLYTRHWTTMQ